MKAHYEFQQGSQAWMTARAGIPTASEFDNLITPKFKLRTGQGPETYLAKKLAEHWIGGPIINAKSFGMDQGNILQDEALPWFRLEYGVAVEPVGFITTDDGRIGASPDGLIGEDGGIEVKCPEAHTHVGYLMDNVVPDDYLLQVHGSLYVTGRKWWKFLSYRRHFPQLLITVERDDNIMNLIDEALGAFLFKFDERLKILETINGGPSKQRARVLEAQASLAANPVKMSWEQQEEQEPEPDNIP